MTIRFLDLRRRFVERTTYNQAELLTSEVVGKRVGWSKVLEKRASVVVAPANFGKTTEMEHQADLLRAAGESCVFIALRRLADLGDFDKALEGANRESYRRWKSSSKRALTIFVDSLDEAAAGKTENIEYLISAVADEVSWAKARVRWVISTRPAVLTSMVFEKLSSLLSLPSEEIAAVTTTSRKSVDELSSTASGPVVPSGRSELCLFSMVELDRHQSQAYLGGRHPDVDSDGLLKVARERGLSGFTRNPGGLDILASIDLLSNPPESLTEVFRRVVQAVHVLRVSDHRFEDAGSPAPDLLERAAGKLASASQVCQLLNIEMPEAKLAISEQAISARLISTPMLPERAVKLLLASQLFIDVGFHQVKMYPDELAPFLAAQRLASFVGSLEQALRLVQRFAWSAPSGERGIQREFLPLMGWLATLNPHCRSVILRYEPQALAFFGDLRNLSIPQPDAEEALTESVRRLVEQGDHPGRDMFTLTSENYWQAGARRMVRVISDLFDKYSGHDRARDVLIDIATVSKLDVLRTSVLGKHGKQYDQLLRDSGDVRYLLELGREIDLTGIAAAIRRSEDVREGVLALAIGKLSWKYLSPQDVAKLIDRQFRQEKDNFSVGYVLESGGILDLATDEELYKLCRGLVVKLVRLRDRTRIRNRFTVRADDRYIELTANTLAALVRRANESTATRVARLCLVLHRTLMHAFGGRDVSTLRTELEGNTLVRQTLLNMVASQAGLSDHELFAGVFGYARACDYQHSDIKHANCARLTAMYKEHVKARPVSPTNAHSSNTKVRKEGPKVGKKAKGDLKKLRPKISSGTDSGALAWVASLLLHLSQNSRYGEVNFEAFELQVGEGISTAVREGLKKAWRVNPPRFDEDNPRSTYHITAAGLQGLHLELGDGTNLVGLSEQEVRRAIRYGVFEINGYPRWFWPLTEAYPIIAKSELVTIAGESSNGPTSLEHTEELFASMANIPASIRAALAPVAWNYLERGGPTRQHIYASILDAVMDNPDGIRARDFERIASKKAKQAFRSPLPSDVDAILTQLRDDAVTWAAHWLTSYPSGFQRAIEKWGPLDPLGVKVFLFHLAAYFGKDHSKRLANLALANDDGVTALGELHLWTTWAVDPAEDVRRPSGVVYSPNSRDNAQSLRDSLLGVIASATSQKAYDILGQIRGKSTGYKERHIRKLQFELRERQYARLPLPQGDYEQFEATFRANVTDSLSFAMAVHADLDSIKYDIERGEHSLRSFFSELDFRAMNKRGNQGKEAGLALEANFQRLLASELNHHAQGRYSVSVESETAESKRRDVLCSRNTWRASIELKMSERWTLDDYLVALEDQLVGQYMRHHNAVTGFLVLVLQTKNRLWKDSRTGKRLNFDEVLRILSERAQMLEAKDRTRYLRVIGIDATAPADFRKRAP